MANEKVLVPDRVWIVPGSVLFHDRAVAGGVEYVCADPLPDVETVAAELADWASKCDREGFEKLIARALNRYASVAQAGLSK